jgi:hypothetical protein
MRRKEQFIARRKEQFIEEHINKGEIDSFTMRVSLLERNYQQIKEKLNIYI